LFSTRAVSRAGYAVAFLILLLFISVGVLFDMVGVAVTSAKEAPFHAMAAHRERGAREAISLVRNAGKVSSVCNDVVGDIAGIVSGTTAAIVTERLSANLAFSQLAVALIVSGAVTGLTIGGKAACKSVALKKSRFIILGVGRIIRFVSPRKKRK
jgi:CBS domain containing-hemolysin-like protein